MTSKVFSITDMFRMIDNPIMSMNTNIFSAASFGRSVNDIPSFLNINDWLDKNNCKIENFKMPVDVSINSDFFAVRNFTLSNTRIRQLKKTKSIEIMRIYDGKTAFSVRYSLDANGKYKLCKFGKLYSDGARVGFFITAQHIDTSRQDPIKYVMIKSKKGKTFLLTSGERIAKKITTPLSILKINNDKSYCHIVFTTKSHHIDADKVFKNMSVLCECYDSSGKLHASLSKNHKTYDYVFRDIKQRYEKMYHGTGSYNPISEYITIDKTPLNQKVLHIEHMGSTLKKLGKPSLKRDQFVAVSKQGVHIAETKIGRVSFITKLYDDFSEMIADLVIAQGHLTAFDEHLISCVERRKHYSWTEQLEAIFYPEQK